MTLPIEIQYLLNSLLGITLDNPKNENSQAYFSCSFLFEHLWTRLYLNTNDYEFRLSTKLRFADYDKTFDIRDPNSTCLDYEPELPR